MALIFFDIDGTLWDFKNIIPQSTKTALRMLKENGHQIFLCSGRTKVFMQDEELFALGFDGISGGCGTEIEYKGEQLLLKTIEPGLLARSVRLFLDYDMSVILEAHDVLFMDEDKIGRDEYGKSIVESMRGVTQPIRGNEARWEACKFTVLIQNDSYRDVVEVLKNDYEILLHGGYVMEVVPKGYTKATSIAFLCERLNADPKDTFAFGDGVNDLEMLDFAGCGIAMGNGALEAKERADYVTDDIHEDGIYNACVHFGLI